MEERALTPIKKEERDQNTQTLLPEIMARTMSEVETYISDNPDYTIRHIAEMLGVTWSTANNIVGKVVDQWRQQDKKKMVGLKTKLFKVLTKSFDSVTDIEAAIPAQTVKELINLLKDYDGLDPEKPGPMTSDAMKSAYNVHFNNLSLTPELAKELERVKEDRPKVETYDTTPEVNS